ncbi:hypothetical protein AN1V17_28280 [Vallitalea sediminicola]
MYKKVGKIVLIVGALCLVFILTIGFIKDRKDTNKVTAQENAVETEKNNETQENTSDEKENSVKELRLSEESLSLEIGDKYNVKVEGVLSDGDVVDLTNDANLLIHSDSEDKVSVIDGDIVVSDKAEVDDQATITYVYENIEATVSVVVEKSTEEVKQEPKKEEPKEEPKQEPKQENNNPDETNNDNSDISDDDTVMIDEEGKQVLTDPKDIHVLVNKQRNLPSDYVPDDLIKPDVKFSFTHEDPKRYMRAEAAHALERLVAQAKEEGIEIVGVSGYRSYKRQETIFNYNVNKRGYEAANKVSAKPGQSEHQTGLAIDVSCAGVNYKLEERLGELEEGIWLSENAHRFGFIIRYKLGKEDITGYQYEPWHIRYLGEDLATDVYEKGLTYEEYFEQYMK